MPPVVTTTSRLVRAQRLLGARPVFLVLAALTLAFCVFAAIDATKVRPDDGTVWLLGRSQLVILDVPPRPDTPSTPLRKRDTIDGIANQLVRTPREAAEVLGAQRPGDVVPYLITRDGQSQVVSVPLTGFRAADRLYALNVLLALVYLLIGGLVYVKSGNDRPAQLFFLLCLCFAIYFMTNLERSSYFWGDILTRNGGSFARFFLPAFFLHFFLIFPERKHVLVSRPWLAPLLYVLPLLFYVRFSLDQFFGDRGARIDAGLWMVLGLYYVAGLVVLMHSYFSYRDPLLRERVRILTWGTLAGVLPFLVFKIGLEEITSRSELSQLGVVPLVAIPVCFGYSVARYQVLQIDFLVKRSLLYSLLSGLVLAGWAAAVFLLGSRLVTSIGSGNPLIAVGVTLFAAAMLWPVRNQLQRALEVRLYRSRANLAALIEQFSREIPGLIQEQALLDHIGRNLQETLDLPRLWFYVPDPTGDQPRWRQAWPLPEPAVALPPTQPIGAPTASRRQPPRSLTLPRTLALVSERLEPLWIDPRTLRRTVLDDQREHVRELVELASGGISLLVPLAVSGRIVGLAALPARPGNESYQVHEIQLLTIVARQAAMQLENTRLYAEELTKQKLEEEMRLARTIQSRLLPTSIPQLPGLQIDAVNVSSAAISGDYYDVIPREDGKIALIIADVSGKGMPASLLASNLQASLRAQCDLSDAPGAILQRVNRQLYATTDSRHFATVFLAFLDPPTRRLRYSTGGHDAPVLVSRDGLARKLDEGGLPLGAFDFGDYPEGEVELDDGDLVLLYTDGLTETRSPDGEDEFGCQRLDAFLRAHRHLDTAALLPALQIELERFRGRRAAEDDITLVALKVAAAAPAARDDGALHPAHAPLDLREAE